MNNPVEALSESSQKRLRENWQAVLENVGRAARQSGRDPGDVKIVGVTKYVDESLTAALLKLGCHDLGESRPQVLWRKAETFADLPGLPTVTWHQIGHVQTNKVRRLVRHHPVIHSIDSGRLLAAVAEESLKAEVTTKCLLEINISGEEAKTGMSRREIEDCLRELPVDGVEIIGLMAMAGRSSRGDTAAQQFAEVRELRSQWESDFGCTLPELSLGMSGDYTEAIAEGATIVRIGSMIFDGLREV